MFVVWIIGIVAVGVVGYLIKSAIKDLQLRNTFRSFAISRPEDKSSQILDLMKGNSIVSKSKK